MEKKIYRSRSDKMIAGVCGGIGEFCDVDPTLVRLIFVVLVFLGLSILAYIIAWIVVPLEPEEYKQAAGTPENVSPAGLDTVPEREDEYEVVAYPASQAPVSPESQITGSQVPPPKDSGGKRSANWSTGVAFIIIGSVILLDRFVHIPFGKLWPVALIIFGMWLLVKKN